MRKYFLVGFISLIAFSCKKDKEPAPDLGYGYFPDAVGKYVIYEGDSVIRDDVSSSQDTVYKFQMKEVIESIFYDNQNRPTMRIVRYKKKYDSLVPYSAINWVLQDVWTANLTKTTAEKVEEGVRFVKLIFPVKENVEWNGNAQNTWVPCSYYTYEAWNYKITSANNSENVNGLNFDSVVTIQQINVSNFIDTKYSVEKYAKNVGLVYKQMILLKKQPKDSNDLPPYDFITVCQQYSLKVIGYGN